MYYYYNRDEGDENLIYYEDLFLFTFSSLSLKYYFIFVHFSLRKILNFSIKIIISINIIFVGFFPGKFLTRRNALILKLVILFKCKYFIFFITELLKLFMHNLSFQQSTHSHIVKNKNQTKNNFSFFYSFL